MKLLTKAIIKKLPALYSQDGKRGDHVVACKFFTPDSYWTWYVLEGEPIKNEDGEIVDWYFFGLVHGHEFELGYFVLSELKAVRGSFGLPIERDLHLGEKTLRDVEPDFCEGLWPTEKEGAA